MTKTLEVTIVNVGGLEAIYVNGKLKAEGDSLTTRQIVEAILDYFPEEIEIEEEEYIYMGERLPKDLSELEMDLAIFEEFKSGEGQI